MRIPVRVLLHGCGEGSHWRSAKRQYPTLSPWMRRTARAWEVRTAMRTDTALPHPMFAADLSDFGIREFVVGDGIEDIRGLVRLVGLEELDYAVRFEEVGVRHLFVEDVGDALHEAERLGESIARQAEVAPHRKHKNPFAVLRHSEVFGIEDSPIVVVAAIRAHLLPLAEVVDVHFVDECADVLLEEEFRS